MCVYIYIYIYKFTIPFKSSTYASLRKWDMVVIDITFVIVSCNLWLLTMHMDEIIMAKIED
jgi:hypothetical protein